MGVNSCGQLLIDQGNFFNTGLLNWDTTAKTANFTAVNGNGYFVNTTSGAVTVTLPAGSAGDFIGVSDYASTSNTNAITISPNGTDKINGTNDNYKIATKGIAVSLLYVDSTRGWKAVASNSKNITGGILITATGGTITTDGDYKIHTFTGPGTFTVCETASSPTNNVVDYLVIAGGGGGGATEAGGGGAGGYRESFSNPGAGGLPVSVTSYPITIGAGGVGATPSAVIGTPGSNSIFSSITSAGGGRGGGPTTGDPGGSGGGGVRGSSGGTGNSPPVTPSQGNDGGPGAIPGGADFGGGGGGGASAAGSPGTCSAGGDGGDGTASSITGSSVTRAGGGGGGKGLDGGGLGGTGGAGGGGNGGAGLPQANPTGMTPGTANTGGGGGGAGGDSGVVVATGGEGGSGIVIIRYKYQ
jgi:hypothetical protein